eukprot:jgi/Chlat1/3471/Chrsp23S03786
MAAVTSWSGLKAIRATSVTVSSSSPCSRPPPPSSLSAAPGRLRGRPSPQLQRRRPTFRTLAMGGSAGNTDEPVPAEMSVGTALELFGVDDDATFDEVLRAKNRLISQAGGNSRKISQIEAAYDVILMRSLQQRAIGKGVPEYVKFADVKKQKAAGLPSWAKGALQTDSPAQKQLLLQTGVFGALVAWTLAGALVDTRSVMDNVPSFQIALGATASFYFLRQKSLKAGRALGLTAGGLVAGAIVGGLLQSWLRVDIVPIGSFSSPAALVSETALISMYMASTFLR